MTPPADGSGPFASGFTRSDNSGMAKMPDLLTRNKRLAVLVSFALLMLAALLFYNLAGANDPEVAEGAGRFAVLAFFGLCVVLWWTSTVPRSRPRPPPSMDGEFLRADT